MKKVSVLLFAILAIGCSEDQIPYVENLNPIQEVASRKADDSAQLIEELVAAHKNSLYTVQQLIESVETEALKKNVFNEIATKGYTPVTEAEIVVLLEKSSTDIIGATNYSSQAKYTLENIVNDVANDNPSQGLQANAEIELINTCAKLYDTGDDNDRGVRTVGFAYGYQSNEAKAIIVATVMSVLAHQ